MNKVRYVVGFLFNHPKTHVALVVKNRPIWQQGKMNGVGGHIEEGETAEQAMAREFVEETGTTEVIKWRELCTLTGSDFSVHFFFAYGNHSLLRSVTDEKIVTIPLSQVNVYTCIPNLTWLIPMALSLAYDRATSFDIWEVP